MSKKQYIIHLKDGDNVKLGGIPYRVMGNWEVMGGTEPTAETIGMRVDYEEVEDEE